MVVCFSFGFNSALLLISSFRHGSRLLGRAQLFHLCDEGHSWEQYLWLLTFGLSIIKLFSRFLSRLHSSSWSADSAGKYLSLKSTLLRSSAKILSYVNLWHCFILVHHQNYFWDLNICQVIHFFEIVICWVGSELYAAATTRDQWLCWTAQTLGISPVNVYLHYLCIIIPEIYQGLKFV